MVSMAGLALFDGKERWMVLSSDDHTLRAFKKRGDAHAVVEVAAAGAEIARRFDVMASSYAIAVRRGGGAQPHELVLGGVAVACDWWAALSQHFALAGDATPLAALSATHANTRTPNKFYAAFAAKNWREMAECYSDAAVFSDRVFKNLDALHVRKMWEMLLTGAKDLNVTFHSVAANAQYAVAHWDATYTFSATGRKVLNRIDATFELDAHGLFVRHADDFSFHAWAVQALGGIGRALGWTAALNNKVSTGATKRLDEFIAKGAVASAPSSSASASAASVAAPAPSAAPAYLAPQHVVVYTERYDVDAARVWAFVGRWLELDYAGVVQSCVGDAASQTTPPTVGGVRTLVFVGAPSTARFSDRLTAYDGAARTLSFSSVSSPLPLENHTATMSVRDDDDGGALFEWSTSFDISDDAADGAADYVVNAMRRLQARAASGLRAKLAQQQ